MHPSPPPWSSDQGDQPPQPSDQSPHPTEQVSYAPPPGAYGQPPAAGPPPPAGPPPGGPYGPPPYGPPPYGPGGGYRPPPPGGNRRLGIIIGVVVAVVVLVCGGSATAAAILLTRSGAFEEASGSDPTTGPTSPPVAESGPITWWPLDQEPDAVEDVWADLAEEFAAQTDAEVTIESRPLDVFDDALVTAIAAGRGPDLHYTAGGPTLRQLVEQGQVRDLTDDLGDVIAILPPATLDPFTIDGRVYGLPYHAGISGIWFNKSLFSQAGLDPDNPPVTWQEFLDAVSALRSSGVAPIAIAGAEDWTVHFWYSHLAVRTAGVEGIGEARQNRSFDDPDLLRAAELLAELADLDPFQPGFDSAGYAGPQGQADSISGEDAAMELMGYWAPSVYEGAQGGLGDDLGWFPFPIVEGGNGAAGDVVGNADGFAVSAAAPLNTLDLFRFLYLDGRYDQLITDSTNLLPVLPGAPDPAGDRLLVTQVDALHTAPAFQLYLDQDLPRPVGDALRASMVDLLVGRASPQEAIARITDAYQQEPD